MRARRHFRGVSVLLLLLLAAEGDGKAEEPAESPTPAQDRCRSAPRPQRVREPDRDLMRLEEVSEALKKTTMQGICGALQASELDRIPTFFRPTAHVQRL